MKKVLLFSIVFVLILGCQKEIVPLVLPEPPAAEVPPPPPPTNIQDTVTACTPFMQRTQVFLDATHFDSAFLQLPCQYNSATEGKTYPLLVFFNGMYEGSNYGHLDKMLKLGPPAFMADSLRFSFKVAGVQEDMIVVCPQSEKGFRRPKSISQILDYMVANYRVDPRRIYLTGLSAGATSLLEYLTDKPEYTNRIAAVVPMSATYMDSTHKSQLYYISNANVHTLIFCGDQDTKYLNTNKRYVEVINRTTPGLAQISIYAGTHKGWNKPYNLSNKYYKPNIYQWLLQYSK